MSNSIRKMSLKEAKRAKIEVMAYRDGNIAELKSLLGANLKDNYVVEWLNALSGALMDKNHAIEMLSARISELSENE